MGPLPELRRVCGYTRSTYGAPERFGIFECTCTLDSGKLKRRVSHAHLCDEAPARLGPRPPVGRAARGIRARCMCEVAAHHRQAGEGRLGS